MAATRGSEKIAINNNYAFGGASTDLKLAPPNSFYSSRSLDFRSMPSQTSVLPAPSAISTNLPGLITAMEQDLNGIRWAVDSKGNIYRIDTTDTISVEATLSENGAAGLLYNNITDQLYIPGQTKVSMYGQVTTGNPGQPRFQADVFAQSTSTVNGCAQVYNPNDGNFDGAFRSTATLDYTIPVSLVEDSHTFTTFSPDIEPGYSISPYISSKGTGDWTLTLHDAQNNSLAAVTITNANLTSNAFNEFAFGKQVRVLVGGGIASGAANYHFHLTSTVNDGTVKVVPASTGTANYATGDLQSLNFTWSAYRLVQTNNGWHPTTIFGVKTGTGNGQALCIGNGNYLSTYNFSNDAAPSNNTWIRHQLVFEYGEEVCGLSANNQFLVIACERRSKVAGRKFQRGTLYFWDGSTPQPSFKIPLTMGAPYGLHTENNITYFIAAGSLYAWSGGQTVTKVRKIAYQNTDFIGTSDTTIINPNMLSSRYGLLLVGYPSSTTNSNIKYGVYSWGAVELTFPNSWGYSYTASHNNLVNASPISNLQIGCVVNFVDDMYLSWAYTDASGTHYGLDLLNNSSGAAQNFEYTALIYDGGSRYHAQLPNRLKISTVALPTGCTITPFYINDRGSTVYGPTVTTGATNALQDINLRAHETQYGYIGTCPPGTMTPPIITGVTLEVDPLEQEVSVTGDG